MGRKKRKVAVVEEAVAEDVAVAVAPAVKHEVLPLPTIPKKKEVMDQDAISPVVASTLTPPPTTPSTTTMGLVAASSYAMTSHSGDLVEEDIYVSDGSEDFEEESEEDLQQDAEGGTARNRDEVEIVLSNSRMGIMRRGGMLHPTLVQHNRQWVRGAGTATGAGAGAGAGTATGTTSASPEEAGGDAAVSGGTLEEAQKEEARRRKEEEELAKMDPAQRAARLLAEKQRKLEEAKVTARRLEAAENAGRDPCLFSKRTAFDIRMDQIEDKPWERSTNVSAMEDYFNYTFTEEDWMEYAQGQLAIRQELTDANRQRRLPDPSICPVIPKAPAAPSSSNIKSINALDLTTTDDMDDNIMDKDADCEEGPMIGPEIPQQLTTAVKVTPIGSTAAIITKTSTAVAAVAEMKKPLEVGVGGAWGAGAAPGSVLARLIEEQERGGSASLPPPPPPPGTTHIPNSAHFNPSYPPPPPPPPMLPPNSMSGPPVSSRQPYHSSRQQQHQQPSHYGAAPVGAPTTSVPPSGDRPQQWNSSSHRGGGRGGREQHWDNTPNGSVNSASKYDKHGQPQPPSSYDRGSRGGGDWQSRSREPEDNGASATSSDRYGGGRGGGGRGYGNSNSYHNNHGGGGRGGGGGYASREYHGGGSRGPTHPPYAGGGSSNGRGSGYSEGAGRKRGRDDYYDHGSSSGGSHRDGGRHDDSSGRYSSSRRR